MVVTVKNQYTELYTTAFLQSGKEAVILLHGGPGVPEELSPLIKFLHQQYQVIYFHQRGTLNSPCFSGDYSINSYISDIDSIAAHFNLQKFHLFGHSWGGLYAQIYAAQRQDKLLSLFLCSPASGTGWQWAKMAMEIRRFQSKKSTFPEKLKMMKNSLLGLLGSNNAYREFYRQFAINCNKGYRLLAHEPLQLDLLHAKVINRTNKSVLLHPTPKGLPDPGFRITVTYGDDDIYGSSPKYVRKRYPTANIITIPKCSHIHWLHNGDAFFDVLADHYNLRQSPGNSSS
jgi:proline iminopeptidase